jgi:thiol-disulfide isomerase/thioredoxin
MKRFVRRFLTLLAVLALVPFSAMAESDAADTNDASKPYVLDAFAGTALDLTQYQGKAVWLNFFTGWCPYCMTEMPYIRQVFDEYDPNQLAIVLVHVWDGENAADGQAVVTKYGLQGMTMLEDEDMSLSGLVGLDGYPTSFFINKEGYLHAGTYGLDYAGMAAYMDELGVSRLDGGNAAATATPAVEP